MAQRLTEKTVSRSKVRDKAYAISDGKTTGLSLLITPSGRRIWRLQLVYPGYDSQARRTLGHFPRLSLADARERAARW